MLDTFEFLQILLSFFLDGIKITWKNGSLQLLLLQSITHGENSWHLKPADYPRGGCPGRSCGPAKRTSTNSRHMLTSGTVTAGPFRWFFPMRCAVFCMHTRICSDPIAVSLILYRPSDSASPKLSPPHTLQCRVWPSSSLMALAQASPFWECLRIYQGLLSWVSFRLEIPEALSWAYLEAHSISSSSLRIIITHPLICSVL